jgi:hypothetical protein
MGVIIAVAALVIGVWAPGRDGQQLCPVRRITSLRRGDAAGRPEPGLTSADQLGCPVAQHHDARVRATAGDRRQH